MVGRIWPVGIILLTSDMKGTIRFILVVSRSQELDQCVKIVGGRFVPWNKKMLAPLKESYDKPRQRIKKQRYHIANKGLSSQSYGFSSSHIGMWELGYKESWALKNQCFWTVVSEKTLESSLDYKVMKPVNPKGNQS